MEGAYKTRLVFRTPAEWFRPHARLPRYRTAGGGIPDDNLDCRTPGNLGLERRQRSHKWSLQAPDRKPETVQTVVPYSDSGMRPSSDSVSGTQGLDSEQLSDQVQCRKWFAFL